MPVPISPYHFYKRGGYQIRESRKGERIKLEAQLEKTFITVFEGLGAQQAVAALSLFIDRQESNKKLKFLL